MRVGIHECHFYRAQSDLKISHYRLLRKVKAHGTETYFRDFGIFGKLAELQGEAHKTTRYFLALPLFTCIKLVTANMIPFTKNAMGLAR